MNFGNISTEVILAKEKDGGGVLRIKVLVIMKAIQYGCKYSEQRKIINEFN